MADSVQAAPLPHADLRSAFSHPGMVLLHAADRSRHEAHWLLFTNPIRYIVAADAASLPAAFADLQQTLASGGYVAGYLTYEAGLALQGLPSHPLGANEPLLCFGVYSRPEPCMATASPLTAPPTDELDLAPFPAVTRSHYDRQIARIQQWIADGDMYQANYTFPLRCLSCEQPLTIFQSLLQQQPAAHAAALRLAPPGGPELDILSFSPELFFRTDANGTIATQPMKGTVARSLESASDPERAAWLAADPKNRAEHVMIVDLLRNDLGRICETGSIRTENLFRVQTLPTVHQMTSDVYGQLRPGTGWAEIFRALFPSGSVTGAPKRHAMHLLHQVENEPRGIYTGAIGFIAPSGQSCFSVAIRTLTLRTAGARRQVTCNVGGGIVADSTAASEYKEAMLKAAFLRRAARPLEIIETVLSEAGRVRWLETHLDRMQRTAEALDTPFSRQEVSRQVVEATQTLPLAPHRVRMALTPTGALHIRTEPLIPWPPALRVRVANQRSRLGDPALLHKTNIREAYDREFESARKCGFDEALFADDAGLLTEACVTNLFFVRDGRVLTPYLECGVLPGVLRTQLLRRGLIAESLLPLADVEACDALLLGNSLRGLYPVRSLELSGARVLTWPEAAAESHLQRLRTVFD